MASHAQTRQDTGQTRTDLPDTTLRLFETGDAGTFQMEWLLETRRPDRGRGK